MVNFKAKIRREKLVINCDLIPFGPQNEFVELSAAFCSLYVPIYSPERPAGDICCAGCGHPAHQYEKLQDLWRKLRYRAQIFWFPLGGKPHFFDIFT